MVFPRQPLHISKNNKQFTDREENILNFSEKFCMKQTGSKMNIYCWKYIVVFVNGMNSFSDHTVEFIDIK